MKQSKPKLTAFTKQFIFEGCLPSSPYTVLLDVRAAMLENLSNAKKCTFSFGSLPTKIPHTLGCVGKDGLDHGVKSRYQKVSLDTCPSWCGLSRCRRGTSFLNCQLRCCLVGVHGRCKGKAEVKVSIHYVEEVSIAKPVLASS